VRLTFYQPSLPLSFLAINPNGRLPALIDHSEDDLMVWESGAILNYLSEKFDKDGKFSGKTLTERAKVQTWLFHQVSGLGPVQGQVMYMSKYFKSKLSSIQFRHARFFFDLIFSFLSMLTFFLIFLIFITDKFFKPIYGEEAPDSVKKRFRDEVERLYQVLNSQLERQEKAGSKFIVLDRLTIADIAFFGWVGIASAFGM